MKKIAPIILIALMVFACSWEIPEAIRIKGKVGIEDFTLNYNLGDLIAEQIDKAIKGMGSDESGDYSVKIFDCPDAPKVFTYLVYMNTEVPDIEIEDYIDIEGMVETATEVFEDDDELNTFTKDGDVETDLSAIMLIVDRLVEDEMDIEDDINEYNEEESDWKGVKVEIVSNYEQILKDRIRTSAEAALIADKSDAEIIADIKEAANDATREIILESIVIIDYDYDAPGNHDDVNVMSIVENMEFTRITLPDLLEFGKIDFDASGFKAKIYLSVKEKSTGDFSELFKDIGFYFGADTNGDMTDDILLFNPEGTGIREGYADFPAPTNPSGINLIEPYTYAGTALPGPHGLEFPSFNELAKVLFATGAEEEEETVNLNIKVRINNQEFTVEELNHDFEITAEIVIWMPLSIAIKEDQTLDFPIPLPIEDGKDLFDRADPEEEGLMEFIKGASLKLQFNDNVFPDSDLKITTKDPVTGDEIIFKQNSKDLSLSGKTMNLAFNKEDLDKINNDPDYYPFVPEVVLIIKPGGKLNILREMTLDKVTLLADIDYRMDF